MNGEPDRSTASNSSLQRPGAAARLAAGGQAPVYPRSCAWPRCQRLVPKSRLMCPGHWSALPKVLQDRIWKRYRPGQTAATCSQEYREALCDVLAWARERQLEQDRAAERLADMQSRQGRLW